MKAVLPIVAFALTGLVGCGAAPNNACTVTPFLQIFPATYTVSSSAASPGNQQQFIATVGERATANSTGCAIPAIVARAYPAWTNPDPIHITISSAQDQTNGTAVCKGPTSGPVTLTANAGTTTQPLTATVQLTCD